MRDLMLVCAVVVHGPYFFVSGAITYEVDLGFGDAGNTAAEPKDDFVGEFVSDDAGGVSRGSVSVLLAQHLRRGDVLDVVEPALNSHAIAADAEIAKSQHGCIWRLGVPGFKFHFCRISRDRERIEAL